MRRLAISDLKSGMILARDVYDGRGEIMLDRGTTLTIAHIDLLQWNAFSSALVLDGIADEVQPPQAISEQIHTAASKHLHELFSLVGPAYSSVIGRSHYPDNNLAVLSAPLVAQLSRDTETIVSEALSANVVEGLISLKSHDNYAFEHSLDVAAIAVVLGKRLRLPMEHLLQLALGGLLYDIGKLFVPPEILATRNHLSSAEFDLIRRHPDTGYEILRDILPNEDDVACHIA